jgi:hypothetical protein
VNRATTVDEEPDAMSIEAALPDLRPSTASCELILQEALRRAILVMA